MKHKKEVLAAIGDIGGTVALGYMLGDMLADSVSRGARVGMVVVVAAMAMWFVSCIVIVALERK